MNIPTIDLPTGRPNFTRVDVGALTLWFSYNECMAFCISGHDKVVRVNDRAQTTGKHLNAIDGGSKEAKAARVTRVEFQRRFTLAVGQMFNPNF
jgi:hypothetical protein